LTVLTLRSLQAQEELKKKKKKKKKEECKKENTQPAGRSEGKKVLEERNETK